MKLLLTLFTIVVFSTIFSRMGIIPSVYMPSNFALSMPFLVKVEPNKELVISSVTATYKKSSKMKTIIKNISLQNSAYLIIPKENNGFKITELLFSVDLVHFDGLSQVKFGGVSMWASHLRLKLVSEDKWFSQVVNYGAGSIGFHGSHPFLCPENQVVNVALSGLTKLKFTLDKACYNRYKQ